MKLKIIWLAIDLLLAGLILLSVWIVDYKLPQKGIKSFDFQAITQSATMSRQEKTDKLQQFLEKKSPTGRVTNVILDATDWRQKFADKFSDKPVLNGETYTSPNLSVRLSYHQYDSGKLDSSNNGKHEKYGSKISYLLADVYVGNITCLQTAFAQDTYGIGYSEQLADMSDRMQAVLAINGDSYSNDRHKDNGTIIRNGVIYRSSPSTAETCVLNWNGTMDIYPPGKLDIQTLIDKGAYQSWIFGPSLLDENGRAKDSFITWDYIRQSHPRTAIGYYEPGHYCLLLVDGRQDTSRGMFLEEMAKLFEDLGCKKAYNLDGGHCSFMNFLGATANHPYRPTHEVPDGIFITEGF